LSTSFFEFEDRDSINHNTALALKPHDPSQNNTDAQSTTSPINRTNNSSSDVLALVHKGSTLSKQGNYTQAIQSFDKALVIDPNFTAALTGKGVALYSLGKHTQDMQYYDKALAVDPNYEVALYNKGNALYSLGNHTQAIQYYDKALAVDPNEKHALAGKGSALDSLGNALSDHGNYTQAIQYYKALAVDPNDKDALNGKGNALSNQGKYTQSIQSFDKALAVDPKNKVTLGNKADALSNQGNYTQAIQYYNKALAIDPKDTYALNGKGNALSNQGNYTQAAQYYDRVLDIDPREKNALDGKGNALSNQGKYTQAIQSFDKALAIDSQDNIAFSGKQDAISKIVASTSTSGYNRGCIDAQIPDPSERYINQFKNGSSFHSKAFMHVYNEGFDACSDNLPKRVETIKMFNLIVLKDNVTDETANTRICTIVSGGGPQTICQNLDNLKPENGSNSIESNVFTFENVPVNASFHSCIQRLIYPNVTLCDNFGSTNNQGPTIEQIMLPFFGVDPAAAQDDEGYGICPQYLTEVQCYGKTVRTPDDGYDINDTSIDQDSKPITLTEQQLPVGSLTTNQIQVSEKPIVTNQKVTLKEGSNITLQAIDPNNKSLNFSIFTEPA
jgi:tetratricopeptide (TPR) repeat protein